MSYRIERAGRAALGALSAGSARVFASFERSCYVDTAAGIACLGSNIGLGPLNAVVKGSFPVGMKVEIDVSATEVWTPAKPGAPGNLPCIDIPESIRAPAEAFLDWLSGDGDPEDSLIGLGPGLTPAGDDFVGGAMIALHASGHAALAKQISDWALPLAATNSNRISRAHLECAARGEGHAYFHDFLSFPSEENLEKLSRIGHTSGLDALAGATNALVRRRAIPSCNPDVAGL